LDFGTKYLGLWLTRVQREAMTTHPLNQRGCDPFRIAHGFIRRHGEMQVSRMDPMEGAQIGPKRRADPCTGTAVHFTSALFVIVRADSCPPWRTVAWHG
jgi:hypothetical protein